MFRRSRWRLLRVVGITAVFTLLALTIVNKFVHSQRWILTAGLEHPVSAVNPDRAILATRSWASDPSRAPVDESKAPWTRPYLFYENAADLPPLRVWTLVDGSPEFTGHLQSMGANDVVYITVWGFHSADNPRYWPSQLDFFRSLACKVVVLANTLDHHKHLLEAAIESIFVSHNAFLDWRLSDPSTTSGFPAEASRPFDMILNSNFLPYKRIALAATVPRLAILTYEVGVARESWPSFGTIVNRASDGKRTFIHFSYADTVKTLNRARAGGIFSEFEGACYASTEYLLAGLPVVSTPSGGGRDIWYTVNNSVIVNPTPASVAAGVELALSKLDAGLFDRAQIRADAIALAIEHRVRFVEHFAGVLAAFENEGVDARAYFEAHFTHKMHMQ